jgi:hypothetical protein
MDFVVGLPPAKIRRGEVVDAVLVIVDRLSKLAIYAPCKGNIDASGLADLIEDVLLTKYGVPESIVSDRGSLFTSKFWTALMRRWPSRRRLSTAFHPQSDGQTERQNQTMEAYLRCFINFDQDDWPYWLTWAEFAYNGQDHASLKCSPFFYVYGREMKRPGDVADDVAKKGGNRQEDLPAVPAAEERADKLEKMREILRENLVRAVAY